MRRVKRSCTPHLESAGRWAPFIWRAGVLGVSIDLIAKAAGAQPGGQAAGAGQEPQGAADGELGGGPAGEPGGVGPRGTTGPAGLAVSGCVLGGVSSWSRTCWSRWPVMMGWRAASQSALGGAGAPEASQVAKARPVPGRPSRSCRVMVSMMWVGWPARSGRPPAMRRRQG
jgi:hypothetical protein